MRARGLTRERRKLIHQVDSATLNVRGLLGINGVAEPSNLPGKTLLALFWWFGTIPASNLSQSKLKRPSAPQPVDALVRTLYTINQSISTQHILVSRFPVSSSASLSKASSLTFSGLYRSLASTGSLASFCRRRSFVVGLYRSLAVFCR